MNSLTSIDQSNKIDTLAEFSQHEKKRIKKIDKEVVNFFKNGKGDLLPDFLQLLKAIEKKQEFKETHYTFLYFQSSKRFIAEQIVKQNSHKIHSISQASEQTYENYRNRCPEIYSESHRQDFIVVDPNFSNLTQPHTILKQFKNNREFSIYGDYYETVLKEFSNNWKEIAKKIEDIKDEGALLFAITVPKRIIEDPHRSFLFGINKYGEHSKTISNRTFQRTFKRCSKKNKTREKDPYFVLLLNALNNCPDAQVICCSEERATKYTQLITEWRQDG